MKKIYRMALSQLVKRVYGDSMPKTLKELDRESKADAGRICDIIWQRRGFSIAVRPVPASELCERLNIPKGNTQYIRELIHHLRGQANPICANSSGYYWARTPDELQESIDSLKGRARAILQARRGLLLAYKKHFNLNLELM